MLINGNNKVGTSKSMNRAMKISGIHAVIAPTAILENKTYRRQTRAEIILLIKKPFIIEGITSNG
jgi:hypothetical protein